VTLDLCKSGWQSISCNAIIKIASDILEEGEDDLMSTWPLWAGLHTCYNGNYNKETRL